MSWSFGRFLIRANMRRIKALGRQVTKDMKGVEVEKRGRRNVSNRVRNSSSVPVPTATPYRAKRRGAPEVPRGGTGGKETTRIRKVEEEVLRVRYEGEEDPEVDQREEAYAGVGELSAVIKKIVYWINQTQVQEVLWHAIEHEKDRYVRHVLETVLAQVERTPEPDV